MSDYIKHLTKAGERWDLLADIYYGDQNSYEPIIKANPYVAITPVLPEGITLYIPVLESSLKTNEELPPWKQ